MRAAVTSDNPPAEEQKTANTPGVAGESGDRQSATGGEAEDAASRRSDVRSASGGSAAPDASARTGAIVSARALLGALAVTAAFVLVFWEFIWRQIRWAFEEQADWGHTIVIPFIAGYFIYLNREKLLQMRFRTMWIALLPIVLGVGWYIFTNVGPQAINHHNLKGVGVGLALFGVVLLFTGWGAMRWLLFPIAYLVVFGQTISNQVMNLITFRMQDIAAVGSEFLFVVLGMDVTRSGNMLWLFHGGEEHPLNIAEACSGMRMLMAFLALAVAMGYAGFRRTWQMVLLVLLAVPIAIFVNMLRVVTLGVLSIFDTEFAAGDFHTFVGLVWLVPAFLLFLLVMWIVKKIVIEEEPGLGKTAGAPATETSAKSAAADAPRPYAPVFDARAKSAMFVCCAALLATGLGFHAAVKQFNIHLRKHPVDLREQFTTIPRTLGPWHAQGRDAQYDASIVESLGTSVYLDRWYLRTEDNDESSAAPARPINVHIAYYTGMIDAVPHIPDRCMVAGGFRQVELAETVPLEIDRRGWAIDPEFTNRRSGERYHLVRFEHRITGRPVEVRMPIGTFELRTTEFRHPRRGDARIYAGFFFIANGHIVANPYEVRALAFDRTDKYAYYCKVQFLMEGVNLDRDAFVSAVGELTSELLPELMRALPDWAEVERRDQPTEAPDDTTAPGASSTHTVNELLTPHS